MVKLRHSLRYLVPFALYFLVAVIITYPLITVLESRLLGHPFGDAAEYVRHIWWIKYALQTGQPIFDQPLLLYPRGLSGSWLWGAPLQSFPAWLFAFVMPLPAAFNLSALLTLALNGTGMYALAKHLLTTESAESKEKRRLTTENTENTESGDKRQSTAESAENAESKEKRRLTTENTENAEDESSVLSPQSSLFSVLLASFLAGLIFMLYPAMQGHLGAAHTGLLVQWGAPLLLLALLRVGESRRWMIAGALLFPVALWGSLLLLIYLVAPILAVYLLRAAGDRRSFRRAVITLLIGGVIAAPFLLPTLRETVGATESGAVRYSSALLGIAAPSFNHPLFGGLEYARQILGADPFESAAYAGVIVVTLALIGVITRRAARWWLIVAAGAWLLSLGALLKLTDAPITVMVGGYATTIPLPGLLM
ncbi:MAG: hypothetical protein IAE80_24975, partial [Anaerolinea sp.]|nr:hypothetical protein [Anaerolinea sp.]